MTKSHETTIKPTIKTTMKATSLASPVGESYQLRLAASFLMDIMRNRAVPETKKRGMDGFGMIQMYGKYMVS
jgi:hypothetical protein